MDKNNKKWYHEAVVYHIYPLSFKDSNNDGRGDINGIIEGLHYLNDGTENSLGVGAIWVSPVCKSPMADFGYDVSDYYDINPIFGTLEDFDRLIKEVHRRGMKILMDFVINHTSKEHPWFLESRSSLNNPKRDWYIWRDPKEDGSPPNNWVSVFGGPAWTYDEHTKQYYFHSFLSEQPDLNWRTEGVRVEIMNIARFWLKRGIDGFRIDALENLVEDSYLRDDPYNPNFKPGDSPYLVTEHIFSKRQRDAVYCVNMLCEVMSEFEDKFIVSESYLGIAGMVNMYRACNQKIHAPFNFNLIGREWSALSFKKFIDNFEASLTPVDWPNYVWGNHDKPRLSGRIGKERLRVAAMLLLTLRGMPFIYYGEELGMEDAVIKESEIRDTFAIRAKMSLGRDGERSPMQWTGDVNAGFSTAKPWLPLAQNYKEVNIENLQKDPQSLLNLYKNLIHYRNNSNILKFGSFRSLDISSPDILAYIREYEKKKILVMLNFSDNSISESFPVPQGKIIMDTYGEKRGVIVSGTITLEPNSGYLFEI